jgi:hypothetical protein
MTKRETKRLTKIKQALETALNTFDAEDPNGQSFFAEQVLNQKDALGRMLGETPELES